MCEHMNKPVIRVFRAIAAWIVIGLVPAILPAATEPESTMTLKKAVEIGLKQNPDLQVARNLARSSEISLKKARGAFLPNLAVTSSGSRQTGQSVDPVTGDYTSSAYTRFSMNASSSLTLFDGFANSSGYRKARENRDAASADLERTRQGIIYSVTQQYINSLTARSFVDVEKENRRAQENLLTQINAFFKAGRRPVADLYQQQAEIAATDYRLQDAEQARQVARITLLQSLGMAPDLEVQLREPLVDTMIDQLRTQVEGINGSSPDEYDRADITAQEKRVAAAGYGIKSARSGYYPSLAATAGVGSSYSSSIPDADLGDQLLDRNLSASLSLNLSIPIFDRGQTRQNVAAAKVQKDNEQIDLASLRRRAEAEVRQAVLNWENASKQLASAASQLKYARAAMKSMEDRYRASAATLTEVSQSRAQYRQARYNHIAARYTLLLRGLEIFYSRGDGEALAAMVLESRTNPAAAEAAEGATK